MKSQKKTTKVSSHANSDNSLWSKMFLYLYCTLDTIKDKSTLLQSVNQEDNQENLKRIQINLNGKILFLQGEYTVNIVILPLALPKVLKSVPVGSSYYDSNRIVQIEWHPNSPCHLLILSTDGILRIFNVSKDLDEPELSLNFLSQSQYNMDSIKHVNKRGMFSSESCNVSGFSIGTGNGWNEFTVYGCFENGQIIAFCPVLISNL